MFFPYPQRIAQTPSGVEVTHLGEHGKPTRWKFETGEQIIIELWIGFLGNSSKIKKKMKEVS